MTYVLYNVRNNPLTHWDVCIRNTYSIESVNTATEALEILHPALFTDWAFYLGYYIRPQPRDTHSLMRALREQL